MNLSKKHNPATWLAVLILVTSCGGGDGAVPETVGFRARDVADAIHTVVAAHRAVYTDLVVSRLTQEGVVAAHEDWQARKTLLLPAQIFRLSAEKSNETSVLVDYSLKSLWPVNQANGPGSEAERLALQTVANTPDMNHYSDETIDGVRYMVATYADRATSPSCVSCHNAHPGSPKRDFKLNDVMGAVIVRIPLN